MTFSGSKSRGVGRPFAAWVGSLLLCAAVTGSGCGRSAERGDDRLLVCVSIPPQKYFVERIGGDVVDVVVMVGPGESPHTYEPKPSQLRGMSRADLFFTIGATFEAAWMGRFRAANPALLVVHMGEDAERIPAVSCLHEHMAEGALHDHAAAGDDPHIWLSPTIMRGEIATIRTALSGVRPDLYERFLANAAALEAELDRLDRVLTEMLAPFEGRSFMVMHPSWGYFARDYGLRMLPIEIGGQEPSPAELASLVRLARTEGIRNIIAQPEFNVRPAELLARELGGEVLKASPLAQDWEANLVAFAEVLVGCFSEVDVSSSNGEH